MAKKKTPFVIDKDDRLYVEVRAVMHPMCAMCDALPMTFFGKGKTAYLDINTAIDWCRREGECHSAEKYRTMIEVMERAKRQLASGDLQINESR